MEFEKFLNELHKLNRKYQRLKIQPTFDKIETHIINCVSEECYNRLLKAIEDYNNEVEEKNKTIDEINQQIIIDKDNLLFECEELFCKCFGENEDWRKLIFKYAILETEDWSPVVKTLLKYRNLKK